MSKHTPGPWMKRKMFCGNCEICEEETGKPICYVQTEEDARLISAAPEMLSALETLRDDFQLLINGDDMSGMSDGELFSALLETVESAIRKATEE